MARLVMGKPLSELTQEEKNALMADMRSRRDGNGRKGYKDPYGLIIKTNNFELEGEKNRWKPGVLAKNANEHVKCVFVCLREIYRSETAYGQTKIYYIGFLSDSNRYSFEEFRESPPRNVNDEMGGIKYRLMKYCQLFQKKNIDRDTTFILCKDGIKDTDFMAAMLKFIWAFSGCTYSKVSKAEMIRKYIREYGIFSKKATPKVFAKRKYVYKNCKTYKPRMLSILIHEIYLYLEREGICPWITPKTMDIVLSLPVHKKRSQELVSIGLFYSVIVKFRRITNKKLKQT